HKEQCYTVSDGDQLVWIQPVKQPPLALLFHDESSFRSGEVSAKRWLCEGHESFHSKGRGRTNMISDFVTAHPSGSAFKLDKIEWTAACREFPKLTETQELVSLNYL
ncbi:unnamed protein product, partial [Didymodactylos carnosus]